MTFFYDLNKRLAALADKQDLHESKVAESEKWIQKAVNPEHKGDLHKALHVAQGEKIPKAKIEKATHTARIPNCVTWHSLPRTWPTKVNALPVIAHHASATAWRSQPYKPTLVTRSMARKA